MDKWTSPITVGSEKSRFGESKCEVSCFNGRVFEIQLSKIPITHVSGGGGNIQSSYGNHVSASVDPVRSRTEVKTEFKMWVRPDKGKDRLCSYEFELDVAEGQRITLIDLNNQMVAYVNHDSSKWSYVKNDEEIAEIAGQRGYLVENEKEIKKDQELKRNGMPEGSMIAAIIFLTFLFVEPSIFWGWNWMEQTSSRVWYLLPGFFAIGLLVEYGRKSDFWGGLIMSLGIGFGTYYFGYEQWGAVAIIIIFFGSVSNKPYKKNLYVNHNAVSEVKNCIYENANFALHHFTKSR